MPGTLSWILNCNLHGIFFFFLDEFAWHLWFTWMSPTFFYDMHLLFTWYLHGIFGVGSRQTLFCSILCCRLSVHVFVLFFCHLEFVHGHFGNGVSSFEKREKRITKRPYVYIIHKDVQYSYQYVMFTVTLCVWYFVKEILDPLSTY